MYSYTRPDKKIKIEFNIKETFSFSNQSNKVIIMDFFNEAYKALSLTFKEDEYFRFINSMSICDQEFYNIPTEPINIFLGSPTTDGTQLYMTISLYFDNDYPSEDDDIIRISINQYSTTTNESIVRLFFDLNLYDFEDFIYTCFRIIENSNIKYLSDRSIWRLLCNQKI
jgi:hypothetical protein